MKTYSTLILFFALATTVRAEWTSEDIAEVKAIGNAILQALYLILGAMAGAAACKHLWPHKK
jgi:surface polysaccharide O-acyltransferase-like enzyme